MSNNKQYYTREEFIVVKEDRDSLRQEVEELKVKVLELKQQVGIQVKIVEPSMSFDEFLSYLCIYYGTDMESISKKGNTPYHKKIRDVICYTGKKWFGISSRKLQDIINRDRSLINENIKIYSTMKGTNLKERLDLLKHLTWINEYK